VNSSVRSVGYAIHGERKVQENLALPPATSEAAASARGAFWQIAETFSHICSEVKPGKFEPIKHATTFGVEKPP